MFPAEATFFAGSTGPRRHVVQRALRIQVPQDWGGHRRPRVTARLLDVACSVSGRVRPSRPRRRKLEDALLLVCATPPATVDEQPGFRRVPASTLRERLDKLVKHGLADIVWAPWGSRPQRRRFPTDKGGAATLAAPPQNSASEGLSGGVPYRMVIFAMLSKTVNTSAGRGLQSST